MSKSNEVAAMRLALDGGGLYEITGRIEDIDKCIVHRSVLVQALAKQSAKRVEQRNVSEQLGEPVPEGYALVGIDALKAWGKYELVKSMCVFPATPPAAQPAKQEQGEPVVWSTTQGGAYVCGEYHVVQRVDDKGWNAYKRHEHLLLAASLDACKVACEQDAVESLTKQELGEPVAKVINGRAYFFDEDALPDETKLYTSPQQRKPLTDEQIDALYEKHVADCWDSIEDQMGDPVRIMTRAIEAAHGITSVPDFKE